MIVFVIVIVVVVVGMKITRSTFKECKRVGIGKKAVNSLALYWTEIVASKLSG